MPKLEEFDRWAEDLSLSDDVDKQFKSIAVSLHRIAVVAEQYLEMANLDLQKTVDLEVERRAEEKAAEIMEQSSRRSFIGKKIL